MVKFEKDFFKNKEDIKDLTAFIINLTTASIKARKYVIKKGVFSLLKNWSEYRTLLEFEEILESFGITLIDPTWQDTVEYMDEELYRICQRVCMYHSNTHYLPQVLIDVCRLYIVSCSKEIVKVETAPQKQYSTDSTRYLNIKYIDRTAQYNQLSEAQIPYCYNKVAHKKDEKITLAYDYILAKSSDIMKESYTAISQVSICFYTKVDYEYRLINPNVNEYDCCKAYDPFGRNYPQLPLILVFDKEY